MDEQLKLAQKVVVAAVDRANEKFLVPPLRYSMEKPESSHAQVWLFQVTRRRKSSNKMSMWNKICLQNLFIYLML